VDSLGECSLCFQDPAEGGAAIRPHPPFSDSGLYGTAGAYCLFDPDRFSVGEAENPVFTFHFGFQSHRWFFQFTGLPL